ncbi:MAG: hypothetical protein RIC03_00135 [Cyclobacteriaceae bacterium]
MLILITICFLSCEQPTSISTLPNRTLTYSELPEQVKDMFLNAKNYSETPNQTLLIVYENSERYTLTTETTGPFTDYHIIHDRKADTRYKVPYGNAFPYVIYENELFIADRFNVANSSEALEANYETFTLSKSNK